MTLHFVPGKGFVDRDTGTLVKDIPTTRGARDYAKTQLKHKTKHAMLPSFTANWDAISKPTRTSCNEKEIDWTKIETQLQTQGYILEQRPQTILPLFTITAPEGHIIAEGKGLTTNDAKRSAIAEAVERIVAKIPPKQTAIGTQKDLDQELLDIDIGPRDLFTEETTTHWVPAHIVTRNQSGLLPAEYAHFDHSPQNIRLFGFRHTTGLSAGSSFEDATLNGILEVLERDAYWIVMRCKLDCPDIPEQELVKDPRIAKTLKELRKQHLRIVCKDISLDWPVPIVHATIIDEQQCLPAFSHGTGAGFAIQTAVARAICEAIQVRAGLKEIAQAHWKEIATVAGVFGHPQLAWSDPLFAPHIKHLTQKSKKRHNPKHIASVRTLLNTLRSTNHDVFAAPLATYENLNVVRVHINGATQPDIRLERISKRLSDFKQKENLRDLYGDPILI